MTAAPNANHYRQQTPAGDLLWSTFDDISIVFDPATGETLVLNALPLMVFRQFDDGPLTNEGLLGNLARISGEELGPDDAKKVESALAYLIEAELVEACTPEHR